MSNVEIELMEFHIDDLKKETLDINDSSHELNVIKQTRKQKIRYNLEYLKSYVKDKNGRKRKKSKSRKRKSRKRKSV